MSILTLHLAAAADGPQVPSGAVEVLAPDAPRDVWLAERRNSIGGSDMSVLTGMQNDRYGSLTALWLDKTGRSGDDDLAATNTAVEWGILLEPVVREWFARTYRLDVRRAGMFRLPEQPFIHANPDGLILDAAGAIVAGIEIKTTSWRQAEDWRDGQCPDHAELQAQVCMLVLGVERWYVVGLIDGRDPQVRLVHRDDELIAMLSPLAEAFYRDYVIPDEAPALDGDGSIATNDAVRAWLATADMGKAVALSDELVECFADLELAKQAVKNAETDERAADTACRVALGDAELVVDDLGKAEPVVYATFPNNGTFAGKRFATAHPELAEECSQEQPVVVPALLKAKAPATYREFCARVIRPRKPLTEKTAAAIAARTDGELT